MNIILILYTRTGHPRHGLYCLYQAKSNESNNSFEEEIELLRFDLNSLKRRVCAKGGYSTGTVLTLDLFEITEIRMDIPQSELFDESDIRKGKHRSPIRHTCFKSVCGSI